MAGRTLEALGLAGVPALEPLLYPGLPVGEPSLLSGRELLPLQVNGGRVGEWTTPGGTLDEVLRALGACAMDERSPVLAVGSNAAPGQVSHKLSSRGLSGAVPLVPVRVGGIGVGLSGHISRAGYVSASPYTDRAAETTLVVGWWDPDQLRGVDSTEFPNYGRAFLPADVFPVTLPNGRRLDGAHLYFNVRGVLAHPDGSPRAGGAQADVLAGLMAESARLLELFGPDPQSWVRRIGGDPGLCALGTSVFEDEGWLLPVPDFAPYAV